MLNFKQKILHVLMRTFCKKSDITFEEQFLKESLYFWKITRKYNASIRTDEDITKMQYTLLRENHVIEKGLSMRTPRKGFGQKKVFALLHRLDKYCDLYGEKDKEFLRYPLATIKYYIRYTEENGVSIPEIKSLYNALETKANIGTIEAHAGVMETSKDSILSLCQGDFRSLLYSRHSIRYFSKEQVPQKTIVEALELAQRTPSACNRQGWKTHVFKGEQSVKLVKWQAGARGFEEECNYSILVTANLKAFLWHEVHQAYIDGGLYAMNLINALHFSGLGTIPLSCGFEHEKLQKLLDFNIPENEVPIVLIVFGNMVDKFNVAVSSRKEITKTNTFH